MRFLPPLHAIPLLDRSSRMAQHGQAAAWPGSTPGSAQPAETSAAARSPAALPPSTPGTRAE